MEQAESRRFGPNARWKVLKEMDIRRRLMMVLGVAAMLLVWHFIALGYDIQLIFPTPVSVLITLWTLMTSGGLFDHIWVSLSRTLIGFLISIVTAIPLGLVSGRVWFIGGFFDSIVKLIYPIPGIAWVPLAIVWFGFTNTSIIFVIFIGTFFFLYISVRDGSANVNVQIVQVARSFRARGFRMFLKVIAPACLPSIITGLRIGIGQAWRLIIAAEMVGALQGLGYSMMEARYSFRTDRVMAVMIIIGVIGYLTERLFVTFLEERTIRKWQE